MGAWPDPRGSTHLKITPRPFRPQKRRKGSGGATVSYTASAPATRTLTIARQTRGYLVKHHCVTKRGKPGKGAPRCTALATLGHITHADQSGRNTVLLSGLLGGHALSPGVYSLTGVARKAGFTASSAVTVTFSITR